jgi:hypothetical protein
MQQQGSRRSTRNVRRREELISSSDDSIDSAVSRGLTNNRPQHFESTLPLKNVPLSSTSLMTNSRRHIDTQTNQDNTISQAYQSKSIPSFADTQLLSIYYLNRNKPNPAAAQDTCVFVEQQERQPRRFRATYDSSASNKFTQTSPPISIQHLSTHGSTIVVDANQQLNSSNTNNQLYEQRLKIHSGSQRLAHSSSLTSDNNNEIQSPSELVEESRYSYEEYIIHVGDNNQEQSIPKQTSLSSPTTTSSATTIIAQLSSQIPPSTPRSLRHASTRRIRLGSHITIKR